ncbi:hypothetical protein D3C78_1550030 [compost metagenome]
MLCLAVEDDVHAVVGHLAVDLGAQADLVVTGWLLGQGRKDAQAGAQGEQGGETGQGGHVGTPVGG